MGLPEAIETVVLRLVLKHKDGVSPDLTISLCNRWVEGENLPWEYFPILESINGLGIEQDEFFPKFRSGSVRLRNSRDTLAWEKRFTDLSFNYAFLNASAEILAAHTAQDEAEVTPVLTSVWTGRVERVEYTTRGEDSGQRISLTIGQPTTEHIITRKLRRSDFPTIPDKSLNKYLPLVFGFGQQVTPWPIQEEIQDGTQGSYTRMAYATNLEGTTTNRFRNIGVERILMQDLSTERNTDRKYYPVESAADIVTPVYSQPAGGPIITTLADINKPRAFWLPYFPGVIGANSYAITSISLLVQGNNSGTPDDVEGEVSIRLHRQQPNKTRPKQASDSIAVATIDKADYKADYAGNSQFPIRAVFNRAVPIVGDGTYWISIVGSNESEAASKTLVPIIDTATATPAGLITHWSTKDDDIPRDQENEDTWFPVSLGTTGQTTPVFDVFGLVVADLPDGPGTFDGDGLGYSYIETRYQDFQTTHPDGPQQVEDINRLDIILEITGLRDVDGTVTGTPDFIVGNPAWQVPTLLHTFDGADWQPGNFDNTRFSSSHALLIDINEPLFRETAGRTFSAERNLPVLEDVCRNAYCTTVYDGFGPGAEYSLLAHGHPRDVAHRITDANARIERWFQANADEVINTLDINYARRLDNIHFQTTLDQEELKDYSQTLYVRSADAPWNTWADTSKALYGERRLKNEDFDWVSGEQSALSLAELFLRLKQHPADFVQLQVRYQDYSELKLYDIVELISTELPSEWGTSPAVYEPEDCDIAGYPRSKARRYKGEITALTLLYNQSSPMTLRILVRLITWAGDPSVTYGSA